MSVGMEIRLTQGKVALIDDEDFGKVAGKWHVHWNGPRVYARRTTYPGGNRKVNIYMHRVILGALEGEQVDHRNGDTLDNRKGNLRITRSDSEQQANRGLSKANTSGFKGVHWHKRDKCWRAQIKVNHKRIDLGRYRTPEEAAAAYDRRAREVWGDFARTNGG
jgi:AP2 domain.